MRDRKHAGTAAERAGCARCTQGGRAGAGGAVALASLGGGLRPGAGGRDAGSTLEVAGRCSGRLTRFPLGMADWQGEWYLVPMLGGRCNWVQNVRAADGYAVLRHGRARPGRLVEVPVRERGPIIRRYLQKGARRAAAHPG